MQKMDCQAIGYGYIIIPKALLKEQLIDCSPHEGEIEAFLKLLIKVNYSETKLTDHQRRTIVCKRGESLHSYRSWSAIFHWPTSRTYRFIQQLKTNGIIEIIPHNDTTALHIRVVDYENWTNISTLRIVNYDSWVNMPIPTAGRQLQKKKASNEKFRLFWDDYHNILQLPKENIAKAQRIWKKLSEKEQQLAIDHIEEYYYHQTNMKFTLHACSYLSNKAFLNEYEY